MISPRSSRCLALRAPHLWLFATALLATAACSSDPHGGHDAGSAGHDASPPETRWEGTSEGGHYGVKVRTVPTPPPVAALFTLEAEVFAADLSTPATVTQVVVDAWMPQHKHGMEGYTPKTTLSATQVGGVTTEGMFFTMPGQWQLTIDILAGAHGKDRVVLPVYVGP